MRARHVEVQPDESPPASTMAGASATSSAATAAAPTSLSSSSSASTASSSSSSSCAAAAATTAAARATITEALCSLTDAVYDAFRARRCAEVLFRAIETALVDLVGAGHSRATRVAASKTRTGAASTDVDDGGDAALADGARTWLLDALHAAFFPTGASAAMSSPGHEICEVLASPLPALAHAATAAVERSVVIVEKPLFASRSAATEVEAVVVSCVEKVRSGRGSVDGVPDRNTSICLFSSASVARCRSSATGTPLSSAGRIVFAVLRCVRLRTRACFFFSAGALTGVHICTCISFFSLSRACIDTLRCLSTLPGRRAFLSALVRQRLDAAVRIMSVVLGEWRVACTQRPRPACSVDLLALACVSLRCICCSKILL